MDGVQKKKEERFTRVQIRPLGRDLLNMLDLTPTALTNIAMQKLSLS